MKYLQEQLVILTRDRKGLSKQVIAAILTQALAMTINQVTQAAKNKGITGNPLTALMDKNPQHLNLILAAAVNAATAKVTKGEVKQLVNPETTAAAALAAKAQHSKPIRQPIVQTPHVPDRPPSQLSASASSHPNNYLHDKQPDENSSNDNREISKTDEEGHDSKRRKVSEDINEGITEVNVSLGEKL
ncbi:CGH_1_collapsed_G0016060.mRNA.1.CDS.1 [Saccharomyces cerevisiae]|nr:CGH_1_collapsed_G0016060.mRNA.1.CDS.1 [Saccharomyces cerevisiae]